MEFSVGFVFEEPNKREATLRVAFIVFGTPFLSI
ncbi:Uncharacterised protein [Yersinia kristensenii]|nr:Uncharacterised protein [Yersinia kristensenii]